MEASLKTSERADTNELKNKLRAIRFPDGKNAANEYVQAFCGEFAARLDRSFREPYMTPRQFVQAYLETVRELDDPEMATLTVTAAWNVAQEVSPTMFAEAVKEELLATIIVAALNDSGLKN